MVDAFDMYFTILKRHARFIFIHFFTFIYYNDITEGTVIEEVNKMYTSVFLLTV